MHKNPGWKHESYRHGLASKGISSQSSPSLQKPAKKKYYVTLYDSVWELTPKKFEMFLRKGATGEGWDINDYKKAGTRSGKVISPLDWSPNEFLFQLQNFYESIDDEKKALAIKKKIERLRGE